jgi:hypothetical protein
LGLREGIALALAPAIGMPAAVGLVITAVDRVVSLVALAILAMLVLALERRRSDEDRERERDRDRDRAREHDGDRDALVSDPNSTQAAS